MKRFNFLILLPVLAVFVLGACERKSAEVIFPEYVAKKKAAAEAKLTREADQNVEGADKAAPQFFRESDSR